MGTGSQPLKLMNLGSLKGPKWRLLFLCSFLTVSAYALLVSDNNVSYFKKDESQLLLTKSLNIGESEQSLQQKRELISALQSLRMHNVTRNQRAVHREYPSNAPTITPFRSKFVGSLCDGTALLSTANQ